MPNEFMSVHQDLIPEAISGQKCYMNMGLIVNSYRDMVIWNVSCHWSYLLFIYFVFL